MYRCNGFLDAWGQYCGLTASAHAPGITTGLSDCHRYPGQVGFEMKAEISTYGCLVSTNWTVIRCVADRKALMSSSKFKARSTCPLDVNPFCVGYLGAFFGALVVNTEIITCQLSDPQEGRHGWQVIAGNRQCPPWSHHHRRDLDGVLRHQTCSASHVPKRWSSAGIVDQFIEEI